MIESQISDLQTRWAKTVLAKHKELVETCQDEVEFLKRDRYDSYHATFTPIKLQEILVILKNLANGASLLDTRASHSLKDSMVRLEQYALRDYSDGLLAEKFYDDIKAFVADIEDHLKIVRIFKDKNGKWVVQLPSQKERDLYVECMGGPEFCSEYLDPHDNTILQFNDLKSLFPSEENVPQGPMEIGYQLLYPYLQERRSLILALKEDNVDDVTKLIIEGVSPNIGLDDFELKDSTDPKQREMQKQKECLYHALVRCEVEDALPAALERSIFDRVLAASKMKGPYQKQDQRIILNNLIGGHYCASDDSVKLGNVRIRTEQELNAPPDNRTQMLILLYAYKLDDFKIFKSQIEKISGLGGGVAEVFNATTKKELHLQVVQKLVSLHDKLNTLTGKENKIDPQLIKGDTSFGFADMTLQIRKLNFEINNLQGKPDKAAHLTPINMDSNKEQKALPVRGLGVFDLISALASGLKSLIIGSVSDTVSDPWRMKPADHYRYAEYHLNNEIEELKKQFITYNSEKRFVEALEKIRSKIPRKKFNKKGNESKTQPNLDRVEFMKYELSAFKQVRSMKLSDQIKGMDTFIEGAKTKEKLLKPKH